MKGPWNIANPLTDDGRNKINEMFQELYNEYREAGLNAKEARNKAEQAVTDALIAKETAEVTREEMLEIIREQTRNGDLAPEIAQARQGHETLGENLNSIKSQLAQTSHKMNKGLHASKNRKPMVSIIDDDGRTAFLDTWLPMLQEKSFKIDISVISGLVGTSGYMTWDELNQLKNNYAVDLINHGHDDVNFDEISESEVRYQFETSKSELFSRGHYSGDVFVYPRGRSNHKTRQIARDYFRGAFLNLGGNNYPPLHQYNLRRTAMFGDTEFGDMSYIKRMVDNAVYGNGWVVFVTHSQGAFDPTKVEEVIDYVNQYVDSGQLEWVHASEGLDKIGNFVDIGDSENTYYADDGPYPYRIIDADGKIHSNFDRMVGHLGTSVDFETPITDFPRDQYSFAYILTSNATVDRFPGGAGVLETLHATNPLYSYQMYKPFESNSLFKRRWEGDAWGKFENIHDTTIVSDVDFNTPITEFPSSRVSHSIITSNNSTISMFPEGPGNLSTYRIGSVHFAYQIYSPLDSSSLYKRSWIDGSWGKFEKIGEEAPIISDYDFNSPPSAFKSGMTTVSLITKDKSDGFPEGPGVLHTYRQGPYQYNYQTYKPIESNSLYIRTSNGNGSSWNSFTKQ